MEGKEKKNRERVERFYLTGKIVMKILINLNKIHKKTMHRTVNITIARSIYYGKQQNAKLSMSFKALDQI